MSGFPFSSLMFLFGILFEPPLAGIITFTFLPLQKHYNVFVQHYLYFSHQNY